MSEYPSRRAFVQSSAAGAVGLSSLLQLPEVDARDADVQQGLVAFRESVEPLVRLIEETPRDSLLERVADSVRRGQSYRNVLAALLLAGIRNVQPRPHVGFKFHCVLVVHSCHLASLAGPASDRWLPIFWALDYFKSSQADEQERSGWRMKAVNESLVPDAQHARSMFIEAMDHWDAEKADTAIAGLVRTAGATEVFNLLARYAARDYRSIGHKCIYLANAWRTLQVIGWQFAEPVLRSLTFALLNHSGEDNPADSDHDADRPWRENERLVDSIPSGWLSGRQDRAIATRLFDTFRGGSPGAAAKVAAEALTGGAGPGSVWDGVFVGAAELLMRRPGIIGLHGLTTANALHYLWSNVADDRLRRRLVLQACSFNAMFRESAKGRGKLSGVTVDQLNPVAPGDNADTLTDILAEISGNRMKAAEKVFGYLSEGGSGPQFIDAARRMLFLKGRDAHDYKFSAAVLEDYGSVSPAWRNQFLAMSVFNLKGSGHPDNGLVSRTRSALRGE